MWRRSAGQPDDGVASPHAQLKQRAAILLLYKNTAARDSSGYPDLAAFTEGFIDGAILVQADDDHSGKRITALIILNHVQHHIDELAGASARFEKAVYGDGARGP